MKQRVYTNSDKFQPQPENYLIKPIELKAEETTSSGLIVGTNQHKSVVERPTMGEIVASGDEYFNAGDTVFWPNTDGLDFEFDNGVFVLIQKKSIVGSLKK